MVGVEILERGKKKGKTKTDNVSVYVKVTAKIQNTARRGEKIILTIPNKEVGRENSPPSGST